MDDPKYDMNVPKDVRILLLAADMAANRGDWKRSSELIEKAHKLTADYLKSEGSYEKNA